MKIEFASNSSLFCLDTTGKIVWNKDGTGFQVATPLLYGDGDRPIC